VVFFSFGFRGLMSMSLSNISSAPVNFYTDTAVEAATLAGKHLLANFRAHQVSIYGDKVVSVSNRSLSKEVTSSNDDEADAIIIGFIESKFPSHNILTEESTYVEKGSPYKWIVDPLDGSGNFVNHNPFFGVSVCLAFENVPITGVIFAPFLEEMIVARKGHGCTINGRTAQVSTTDSFEKTYVVGCPGGEGNNRRFSSIEQQIHHQNKDFRKIGSAAVESYMVAAGRADAFLTLNISPWDVAAGALAVQEAGGLVSDFDGNPWTLEKSDLLMSNGIVHDRLLEEIAIGQTV